MQNVLVYREITVCILRGHCLCIERSLLVCKDVSVII